MKVVVRTFYLNMATLAPLRQAHSSSTGPFVIHFGPSWHPGRALLGMGTYLAFQVALWLPGVSPPSSPDL